MCCVSAWGVRDEGCVEVGKVRSVLSECRSVGCRVSARVLDECKGVVSV